MDEFRGEEEVYVDVLTDVIDRIQKSTVWVCEKWSEDACGFIRKRLDLHPFAAVSSAMLKAGRIPAEEVVEVHGNLMLNAGLQRLRDLLVGAGGTAFNNANSRVGVGNSATAEVATQTDLQAAAGGANRQFKTMNATFPTTATQLANWASDFTSGEANFVWNEWGIDNGNANGTTVTAPMLNRKVASLGTKATGTWTLTGTITFS